MLKHIFRKFIFPILYRIRIPALLFKFTKKNLILCYHGIEISPNFNLNNRHILLEQIEKDIIFLKRYFNLVTIPEIFLNKNVNKNNKPNLCLTFDDGYYNNYTNLIPLASKHNIPVNLFIITESIDNPNYITWYDLIDLIKIENLDEIVFDDKCFKKVKHGLYQNGNISIESYIKLLGNDRDMKLRILSDMYHDLISKNKLKYYSNWKLIDNSILNNLITNDLIYIGSHTHSHYNLANIEKDLAHNELNLSKKLLETKINKQIEAIAYPDGSYNEEIIQLSEKDGYKYLLAVEYQFNENHSKYNLRNRYSVSNSTTHEANMLKIALNINKYGF